MRKDATTATALRTQKSYADIVRRVAPRAGKLIASTRRCLFLLLLQGVFAGVAWPQQDGPVEPRQEDRYTIRVNVGMAILHATVRDRKGHFASGLGEEHFQVYEDGVLQQIQSVEQEDIPVTVGLVVDNSGSMRPKRPEVVAAALEFVRFSNPEDEMFVINFNENVSFGLSAETPFTDEASRLHVALSRMRTGGMTALYDAIAAGLEHVDAGNWDKKVLIVVSDGADNASKLDLAQITAMAEKSEAILYTIGLFMPDDPDRNPGALRQLARATGGEAFLPQSATGVLPIFERIAHDIRNQYRIVYAPTNETQDGTYRTVEVRAVRPGGGRLFVRTRTGYHAPFRTETPTGDARRP